MVQMGARRHPEEAETLSHSLPSRLVESRLKLLVETGLLLAQERSLEEIVQGTLEAGLQLCGAETGAFFYLNADDSGSIHRLVKSAVDRSSDLNHDGGSPLLTAEFAQLLDETFEGKDHRPIRSEDITSDRRYDRHPPSNGSSWGPERAVAGAPNGKLETHTREEHSSDGSIHSFLAISVRGRAGDVLGALLYGHSAIGVFTEELESLVTTLACQAAVAIENARLALSLSTEVALSDAVQQLQRLTASRLRQALDAAGLGTFTWDRSTDLLDLDDRAAELFQVVPNIPVHRSALRERLVIPEDRERTLQNLRDALQAKGTYNAEYRVSTPEGAISWLTTNGMALVNAGEVTGMTGIVQDITTRKTQEAALIHTEKLAATGRLAASIAHEINNPLEAITNLIYLVKTDPALPSHLAQMMELADSELARVGELAQHTLGFYRDTAHPAEVDLSRLLAAVTHLFAVKLGHKRLQCTLDVEPNLNLFGFEGEMRQIFSNLLVNAIDATTTGTIHLRARSRALGGRPGVVVLMSDTGSGIPHHARKRLFSPFFTTKETTGTGLGLWVTRGMVEKHGGKIGFRSTVGTPSGTIFRVHLPQAYPLSSSYSGQTGTRIQ